MNGLIENKWARVPKAWEDPPDIDGMPLPYEDINKEENAASVNPPVSYKKMIKVSEAQQTMPFPQFVDSLKNLLEVAFTVLQREEQEMEVEWAEARDESLRVMEEGLATLQHNVAKSLMTILDSLDRGQRLQRRAKDAERRTEKERWRKSHAETEKWMKRLAEKSEGGRKTEGWCYEKEEEDVSGTCLEVRQQVQIVMDKAESEWEEGITESDGTAAKQELAIMEVLMDQLGAVEETCRRQCKITQDRMSHLWETIEKNRSVRTDSKDSGISEQYPSSVTALAILEPCLVRGRRSLLPPITSLNDEGGKCSAIQTGTGTPTKGVMRQQSENHREKKKRRKKKVEMKEGDEEEEVIEKNEENEKTRKSWKQRLTEWLHAPLCGCAVRCY